MTVLPFTWAPAMSRLVLPSWNHNMTFGLSSTSTTVESTSWKLSTIDFLRGLSGSTKIGIAVVCCGFLSSNPPSLARSSKVDRSSLIALRAMRRSPFASASFRIRFPSSSRSTISSRRQSVSTTSSARFAFTRALGRWFYLCLCTAASENPWRSDMFRNGSPRTRERSIVSLFSWLHMVH